MADKHDQAYAHVSPRRTRQRTKQLKGLAPEPSTVQDSLNPDAASTHVDVTTSPGTMHGYITKLPAIPSVSLTRLKRKDHSLLLRKQEFLRSYDVQVPRDFRAHSAAVDATLVFAQEEAGTAICVAPEGLLLTCSHCVAETEDDIDYDHIHWLLFSTGIIVGAKCIAWDSKRDLALLQVVSAQDSGVTPGSNSSLPVDGTLLTNRDAFSFVELADSPPSPNSKLVCIGHPGSEDLEADVAGLKTNYDVLHLSVGAFRGLAEGQDVHDNSEIGALMHDCWTYWGHSGAPLLDRRSGRLVGLHSSWDDETAMRRGVPLEAIQTFLKTCSLFESAQLMPRLC